MAKTSENIPTNDEKLKVLNSIESQILEKIRSYESDGEVEDENDDDASIKAAQESNEQLQTIRLFKQLEVKNSHDKMRMFEKINNRYNSDTIKNKVSASLESYVISGFKAAKETNERYTKSLEVSPMTTAQFIASTNTASFVGNSLVGILTSNIISRLISCGTFKSVDEGLKSHKVLAKIEKVAGKYEKSNKWAKPEAKEVKEDLKMQRRLNEFTNIAKAQIKTINGMTVGLFPINRTIMAKIADIKNIKNDTYVIIAFFKNKKNKIKPVRICRFYVGIEKK